MCLYGDPAYPLQTHLQVPFRMVQPNANMEAFNKSMSSVRISVEWLFGDVVSSFAFIDSKKDLKVALSSVAAHPMHSKKFLYWSGQLLSLSCPRAVLKCLSARGWTLVNSSPWSPSLFGKMVSKEKHSRPYEGFYRTMDKFIDKLTDKKYKKVIVAYNIDNYHYSLAFVNSLHSTITRHDCIQVHSAYKQNRQTTRDQIRYIYKDEERI